MPWQLSPSLAATTFSSLLLLLLSARGPQAATSQEEEHSHLSLLRLERQQRQQLLLPSVSRQQQQGERVKQLPCNASAAPSAPRQDSWTSIASVGLWQGQEGQQSWQHQRPRRRPCPRRRKTGKSAAPKTCFKGKMSETKAGVLEKTCSLCPSYTRHGQNAGTFICAQPQSVAQPYTSEPTTTGERPRPWLFFCSLDTTCCNGSNIHSSKGKERGSCPSPRQLDIRALSRQWAELAVLAALETKAGALAKREKQWE